MNGIGIHLLEERSYTPVTIGADPEFLLWRRAGRRDFIHARDVLREVTVRGVGNFGLDGHSSTGELRPNHNEDPLVVVENCRKLITKLRQHLIDGGHPTFMTAGSGRGTEPCGGHIHIGHEMFLRGINAKVRECASRFDKFLGLPLALISENTTFQNRVVANNYGQLGQVDDRGVRSQTWGFEYRTPPSWLHSQEMAAACLCIAKVVAEDYILADRKLNNNLPLQIDPIVADILGVQMQVLRERLYSQRHDHLRTLVMRYKDELTQADLYSTYQTQIQWSIGQLE